VSENKKEDSSARQYLTTHCWKKVLEVINLGRTFAYPS
jgi:hypothetical protein